MNRKGLTVAELLIVIVLIGAIAAIAFPRIRDSLTREGVRSARGALVTMHAKARATAIQRARATQLVIQGDIAKVVSRNPVTNAVETVEAPVDLNGRYGVTVTSTRDTFYFDPRGLGLGTTTDTITITRASYVDRVVISSMGRVAQ